MSYRVELSSKRTVSLAAVAVIVLSACAAGPGAVPATSPARPPEAVIPTPANVDRPVKETTGRYLHNSWGSLVMFQIDARDPARCKTLRDAQRMAAGDRTANISCHETSIADRLPVSAVLREGTPPVELEYRYRNMNICVKALADPSVRSENIVRTCTE